MAIERDTASSNRTARLLLNDETQFPRDNGNHAGSVVLPDRIVPEELVDYVTNVEHKLNLDDLRAQDAEAKMVRFEQGTVASFGIREHMLKTLIDARKIEKYPDEAARIGAELRRDIEDVKEYRIAALVTSTANYPSSNKANAIDFSAAGIRALYKARRAAVRAGGFDVTDWIMGEDTMSALQNNPDIQKWFGDKAEGYIDESVVKAFFRIPGQVKVANYSRVLGNTATPTQFWPSNFSLMVSNQASLSTRTFGITGVMTYGAPFGRNGVITDVRTAPIAGVEMLTEVGAAQRYTEAIMNSSLGFLDTGVVGA